ncbi:MAG: hypothetical protein AB1634_10040 [Thermodesulfobacteriota bacterium]
MRRRLCLLAVSGRPLLPIGLALGLILAVAGPCPAGSEDTPATEAAPALPAASESAVAGALPLPAAYRSVLELVMAVAAEAGHHLEGFFKSNAVDVAPFLFLAEVGRPRVSELGLLLADQLQAEINTRTHGNWSWQRNERVDGLLVEVDGQLRIQLTAVNSHGRRLSRVFAVEMSRPVYRALAASPLDATIYRHLAATGVERP